MEVSFVVDLPQKVWQILRESYSLPHQFTKEFFFFFFLNENSFVNGSTLIAKCYREALIIVLFLFLLLSQAVKSMCALKRGVKILNKEKKGSHGLVWFLVDVVMLGEE